MSVFQTPNPPSAEDLIAEGQAVGHAIRFPGVIAELGLRPSYLIDPKYAVILGAVLLRVEAGQPVSAELLKADLAAAPALSACGGAGLVDVLAEDAASPADMPDDLVGLIQDRWRRRIVGQIADVLHSASEEAATNARGITSRASGEAQARRFADTIAGCFAMLRAVLPPMAPWMLGVGEVLELLPIPLMRMELEALAGLHEQNAVLAPDRAAAHHTRAAALRSLAAGMLGTCMRSGEGAGA